MQFTYYRARTPYDCQNRFWVKTLDTSKAQRLLIVEDDVHMAYLLGYLAEKERFAVESIADGRKAIERIERGDAVDLVLLDVMLPYTDGFELLEKLRAHESWRGVPVIILTSRTREHDAVRALGLGADDYLTKPFSPAELVARIRRRIGPRSLPT
jgi:DNA-binding response OmpR family regulator